MSVYFVRKSGNDANDGLAATVGGGHGPWLTLGKALGASGIASGDHLYVGAGRYGEAFILGLTSPTVETKITGDVDGSQTGDAGDVIWTGYTSGDSSAPSASVVLTIGARNFLTFENITFVAGGNGLISYGGGATPTNITFTNCLFYSTFCANANMIFLVCAANTAAAWLFDRCEFFVCSGAVAAFRIDPTTSASADYDMGILIRNSVFTLGTGYAVRSIPSGAGAFKGGGLRMDNCTILGGSQAVLIGNANWSTTYPLKVYSSIILGQNAAALQANTLGQIVEDYNVLSAVTPRTNVAIGTHSQSGNPPSLSAALEVGQHTVSGRAPRTYGVPIAGGALLGFGQQAGGPSTDLRGDTRPLGGQILPACGALERRNTAVQELSVVRNGTFPQHISGPGCQDYQVPVQSGVATTLSIYAQYNGSYTGPLPSLNVLAEPSLGVAAATATQVGASGAWEHLSLTFTPTASGYVTMRLLSSSTAAAGIAYFDDYALSP